MVGMTRLEDTFFSACMMMVACSNGASMQHKSCSSERSYLVSSVV